MKFPPLLVLILALWSGGNFALAISTPAILEPTLGANSGNGEITLRAKIIPNEGLTKVNFSYGLEGATRYEATTTDQTVTGDSNPAGTEVSSVVKGLIGGKKYRFKVTASNAAGSASKTEFSIAEGVPEIIVPYQPALTANAAKVTSATQATVGATVTANGSEGYAIEIRYGTVATNLDRTVSSAVIDKDAVARNIAVTLGEAGSATNPPLERDKQYFYRILLKLGDVVKDTLPRTGEVPGATTFTFKTTNQAPKTRDITVVLRDLSPVVVEVLKNRETDVDGDKVRITGISPKPSHGIATIKGKTIVYTPGEDFIGTDLFSYLLEDGREGSAVGTVIVRSARAAVRGRQSVLIKDAEGKTVGMARLQVGSGGAFSGRVEIDGKSYQLIGEFDAEGRFRGTATGEDGTLEVNLSVALSGAGSTLAGTFGGDRWNASASLTPIDAETQAALAGRYTLELPAAAATPATGTEEGADTPATTATASGWAIVKLNEFGEAKIKGKTSDGTAFSTRAVLGGTMEEPTLNFYAIRKNDELVGELTLSDTVGGSIAQVGGRNDETISVNGAPYFPPQERQRLLETSENEGKFATATISGDGKTVTHQLRFSKENKVEVLDANGDGFSLKVDDDTLVFTGKKRREDGRDGRDKISGVFNQKTGIGRGLVTSDGEVRRIEITPRAATTPDTTTPDTSEPATP
ncbi:MAG: Ig-like domain-containing protein [Verrucomicrobiota bacterium]